MCFLETGRREGDGAAVRLRAPAGAAEAPSRIWHVAKWMFNRLYWETVPKGRIPERAVREKEE